MDRRRRRLSRLYLKKHFRRSLRHDCVERTIPNGSVSIISVSSTDAESFNKDDKGFEDSDNEIISPSPNRNKNMISLPMTQKRIGKKSITKQCGNVDEQNLSKDNSGIFKDLSILHYEKFKTLNTSNHLLNSTMLCTGRSETHQIDENDLKNSILHDISESMNKSLENLLDNIYGDSWRPFKEKVLPKSERKAPKKKLILKQVPATERNYKKNTSFNEAIEKHSFNYSLHGLEMKDKWDIKNYTPVKKKGLTDDHSLENKTNLNPDFEHYHATKNSEDRTGSDKENSFKKYSSEPCPRRKLFDNENFHKIPKDLSDNKQRKDSVTNTIELSEDKMSCKNKCDAEISPKESSTDSCSGPNLNPKTSINSVKIPSTFGGNVSSPESDDSSGNVRRNGTRKKIEKRHFKKFFDSSSNKSDEAEMESKNNYCDGTSRKIQKGTMEKNRGDKELKQYSNFEILLDRLHNDIDSQDEEDEDTNIHTKSKPKRNKKTTCSRPNLKGTEKKDLKSTEASNIPKKWKEKVGEKCEEKNLRTRNHHSSFINCSDSDDSLIVQGLKELNLKTTQPRTYSFLASLSSNIPDDKCDPSARIFKKNFKRTREELAIKLFSLYNKEIFNNLIPKETPLQWNGRMLSTAGFCYSKKITHRDGKVDLEARIALSSKVLTTPDRLRDTLIHEMCHAATWLIDGVKDGHGIYWKAWAKKARTAFPELPPIKTCHNYEINSKYVYKCSNCGYSIKRHRKSLDLERKRCGYCYGKFELFMNKVNKKGEQHLVPADTPKKPPKGFALFVQENYSKYKNMNSAQAMKLLSKDFKEMKLG